VPFQITGAIVRYDGLFLPNKKHKNIHEEVIKILKIIPLHEQPKQIEQTIGRVIAAAQLDATMSRWIPFLRQRNVSAMRLLKKQSTE